MKEMRESDYVANSGERNEGDQEWGNVGSEEGPAWRSGGGRYGLGSRAPPARRERECDLF